MQKFLIAPCKLLIFNKKARLLLKAGNKSVTKRTNSSRLAGFLKTKVINFLNNQLSPLIALTHCSNKSSGIALKSGCLLWVLTFTSFWKSPVIACCLGIT